MKTERISGLLNNCSLNCALPTLLEHIDLLAKNQYELSNNDSLYKQDYEDLKDLFMQWFGIANLGWVTLANLLKEFSFREKELILTPVLRAFLASKATDPNDKNYFLEIVDETKVNEGLVQYYKEHPEEYVPPAKGKYNVLNPSQANQNFYHHFGLHMVVYKFNEINNIYEGNNIDGEIDGEANNYTIINVYLKNNHFELQEHHLVLNYEKMNKEFEKINDEIGSTASKETTTSCLNEIKGLVKEKLSFQPCPSGEFLEESIKITSFDGFEPSLLDNNATSPSVSDESVFVKPPSPEEHFQPLVDCLGAGDKNSKKAFLKKLREHTESSTGNQILAIFKELRKINGQFKNIHQERNRKWDRCFLFFKRKANNETNFWHTKTYQEAIKILKNSYVKKIKAETQDINQLALGQELIDYVRGNSPIHHENTSTRKNLKK
ncbi:MAG: hypothetical protein A3F46_02005 [Legionellales bacterium RIFCSPHIGHO2_12_FULL_42_9]|nr:MAG: hypothetical protein A3F46_02005 [Legionellales bacterium RIFCSPHIGHO2_12_FULL_42_9]